MNIEGSKVVIALDKRKPTWWVDWAQWHEIADCVLMCTDGHSGTVEARLKLRAQVYQRLVQPMSLALMDALDK